MTDANASGGAVAESNKSNALIIYVLYLVSLVVGVTAIVGVIMAYVSKTDAPEWLKSHYVFLIRTFWIVRCAQGLNLLSKNQPVPNYQTWMFV